MRYHPAMARDVLILVYDKCSTCRRALAWLRAHGIELRARPIVEQPPTKTELGKWLAASGVPVRKWLNTSGQSYRALGKAKIDASSDAELLTMLSQDGKLVKRPVLVAGERVLVGFRPEEYAELFGG
jgi:arsenate reductase